MFTDRNIIDEDIMDSSRKAPDIPAMRKNNQDNDSIAMDISKGSPTKTMDISESLPRDMSVSASKNDKSSPTKKDGDKKKPVEENDDYEEEAFEEEYI
jgi:hypothetical protein